MPAAMPFKTTINGCGETCRSFGKHKTKHACIVDADEYMRIRLEGVPCRYHEDDIAAKGINSLSHYNWVHKSIPMPQALKYRMRRRQWKIMVKLEKIARVSTSSTSRLTSGCYEAMNDCWSMSGNHVPPSR